MSRHRIELEEHLPCVVDLAAPVARDIAAVTSGKVAVTVGPEPGTWVLTPGTYAGTVVTPTVEIIVRPKVPLHNVFLLLDVGLPSSAWREETFSYGSDRNLLPALAAFFSRTLEHALAGGLRRDYRAEESTLIGLRGRIDITKQLRRAGVDHTIACRYDEYTADITENRALKAAVRRLLRLPGVSHQVRRVLARELTRFEEVEDLHVEPDDVGRIIFTRLNRHYEAPLRLAELVLRNATLLDRVGKADASAFLVDMPQLFQRWLTERLRRRLRNRLDVDAEPTVYLGEQRRVPMAPDLTFRDPDGRLVYVGDAKYKLVADGIGRSGDYYQLLAYTVAGDVDEGVLIYAQAEGTVPDREVVVRHLGKRLWTYSLPLSGSPEVVEREVGLLADWIAGRAATSSLQRHLTRGELTTTTQALA